MNARGVVVSCVTGEGTSTRCSGILLDNTWVLTTGSILSSLVQNTSDCNIEPPWKHLLKTLHPGSLFRIPNKFLQNTQMSLSVLCPATSEFPNNHVTSNLDALTSVSRSLLKYVPKYHRNNKDSKASSAVSSLTSLSPNYPETFKGYKSNLSYIWKSPHVIEAVDSLLSSWVLGNTSSGNEDSDTDAESEIAKHLLPLFLIIKLDSDDCDDEKEEHGKALKILLDLFEQEEDILKRGRRTVVESTPFGNPLFYNSVSEGIVSNIVGPGNCLILTDARTALGCEGGPIFILTERNRQLKIDLVGMVVCSLSWWRGEWIGFTLGVTLKAAVYHCVLEIMKPSHSITPTRSSDNTDDKLAFLDDCLVLVRCGAGWGSGIVIDARKGIVLTCSHVVRKAQSNAIEICWKNLKKPAKLLFRSRDELAYDVAVLKVEPGMSFKSAHFCSRIPVKGEPVVSAGFPLFSEDDNNRPTVTRGVVSHVSTPAAMIQTTCCVQSGASGGAIFWSTGELMGLISCNTQDIASGALYPHINMAVPICVLRTNLLDFVRTGDVHHLKSLESADPAVQSIWKLQSLNSKL